MKGFVTDPNSDYLRVLSTLLGKAAASYDTQVYRFTTELTLVGKMPFSQMQSPNFYNGLDTPLSELFSRIADERRRTHRISVLVSDLVQSERMQDHTDLLRSLRRLTGSQPEILLLGFRSHFRGEYVTETYPKRRIHFPEGAGYANRPFYVLVVAPDSKSLVQFRRDVFYGVTEFQVFHPSRPLGSVKAARYAPLEPRTRVWNLHKPIQLEDTPLGSKRLLAYFSERDVRQGDRSNLQIEVTFDDHMQLKDASAVGFLVRKAKISAGKKDNSKGTVEAPSRKVNWEEAKVPASLSPRVLQRPGTAPAGKDPGKSHSVFVVDYQFTRPSRNSWDVYKIEVRAGIGNIDTPRWVYEWSTDYDQTPAMGDRTLHLDLLIDGLLKGVAENVVFSEQYIFLGRGTK